MRMPNLTGTEMIDIGDVLSLICFTTKTTKFSAQKKFGVDPKISYITEIHFLF